MATVRKEFEIEEQLKEDLMNAIKVVRGVIPLLKNFGDSERKSDKTDEIIQKIKKEISAFEICIEACKENGSESSFIENLNHNLLLKREQLESEEKYLEEVDKALDWYNQNLMNFLTYARLIEKLLHGRVDVSEIEINKLNEIELKALMFILNSNRHNYDIEFACELKPEFVQIIENSNEGWNYYLRWLKGYEQMD